MIIITNVKNDVPMSKEELEKRIRDIEKRLKELEYKHAIIGKYRDWEKIGRASCRERV